MTARPVARRSIRAPVTDDERLPTQSPPGALRRRQWLLHAAALPLGLPCAAFAVAQPGIAAKPDAASVRPWARELIGWLTLAADDGLDPADYGADYLARAWSDAPPTPEAQTAREAALLAACLRFLKDMRQGRVEPRQVHQAYTPVDSAGFDPQAALAAALAQGQPAQALQAATPPVPLYKALRSALKRCRALGEHPAWQQALPAAPVRRRQSAADKAAAGKASSAAAAPAAPQPWRGAGLLAQRLAAWGDLPALPDPLPQTLEEPLLEGLRSFQRRHGLKDDAVLGPATLKALNVNPAQRAEQIVLTMERLRWTPLQRGPRMIVVNLPEFVLRAYELQADGRVKVREEMKVIVGRALNTRTPQFDELMRHVEFSPYWNVPPSIARGELVPRLRRDPGYFTREGFEFVDGSGRALAGFSTQRLDEVMAGRLRIRQRPGERNALGDVKFVFPNRDNIYLHHTPSTSLFERERRDFSHGCIRVERPVDLARFVLQDEPGWTDERIRAAMSAGASNTQKLSQPLPVLITYGTALVLGGRPHFFEDIYGHDGMLKAALAKRPRPPVSAI